MQEVMLIAFLLTCFACDCISYKIPNSLIWIGYITGFFASCSCISTLYMQMFTARILMVIVASYFLFLIRALGAGDIKMLSVIPAFASEADVLKILICSILIGGIISLTKRYLLKDRESCFHFSICIAVAYILETCWR